MFSSAACHVVLCVCRVVRGVKVGRRHRHAENERSKKRAKSEEPLAFLLRAATTPNHECLALYRLFGAGLAQAIASLIA
jgi:hypothetical protein